MTHEDRVNVGLKRPFMMMGTSLFPVDLPSKATDDRVLLLQVVGYRGTVGAHSNQFLLAETQGRSLKNNRLDGVSIGKTSTYRYSTGAPKPDWWAE